MAPEVLPDIAEVVSYLTPQGSMAQGCYKLLTTDHRPLSGNAEGAMG